MVCTECFVRGSGWLSHLDDRWRRVGFAVVSRIVFAFVSRVVSGVYVAVVAAAAAAVALAAVICFAGFLCSVPPLGIRMTDCPAYSTMASRTNYSHFIVMVVPGDTTRHDEMRQYTSRNPDDGLPAYASMALRTSY